MCRAASVELSVILTAVCSASCVFCVAVQPAVLTAVNVITCQYVDSAVLIYRFCPAVTLYCCV